MAKIKSEIERRVGIQSLLRYHHILKVYYKKSIEYGQKIEVFHYDRVKYSFRNKSARTYERNQADGRRGDSVARARNAVYRLVEGNVGRHGNFQPIFLTLTFKKNIVSIRRANNLFKDFTKRLNYRLGTKIKYIVVPEFQKRGAVHYHIVYFNLPYIDKAEIQRIWGHGFTRIETVRKVRDMGAYLSKYLSKSMFDNRLYGEKAYFCSRGLLRPKETFGGYEVDKIIEEAIIKTSRKFNRNNCTYTIYEKAKG